MGPHGGGVAGEVAEKPGRGERSRSRSESSQVISESTSKQLVTRVSINKQPLLNQARKRLDLVALKINTRHRGLRGGGPGRHS